VLRQFFGALSGNVPSMARHLTTGKTGNIGGGSRRGQPVAACPWVDLAIQ
jgi:hypothetical protein